MHTEPVETTSQQYSERTNELSIRWSLLAALPIALCLCIMGLPDMFVPRMALFRGLYAGLFVFWIFPLCLMQRRLRRFGMSWARLSLVLLALTYGMSVFNSWVGLNLALHLGLIPAIRWHMLFSGLDSCWLALVGYCALHALLINQRELALEQLRAARATALAREAQLRALRYQLNPHFLFNTLNAVSALVVSERNRDAVRMIGELGEFLRSTLDSGTSHEHSVANELALTESYLNIEKARLGTRLNMSIHVGAGVLQAMVPYLLLQPLLENAIRHGIAPLSDGGTVSLALERVDASLHISLANDMDQDAEAAKANKAKSTPEGVGIRNVSERLTNLYEDAHELRYQQGMDGRFTVEVTIPFRTQSTATIQDQALMRAA